ncbi:hypothetical protein A9G34_04380 [Gilliamella sp. Choc4-2]|jgi:hypothetical protein|uniref:hypothetical protein n=1 Tax=unclassified Gilliamella TaxID=2685620 RepID=UPI0004DCCA6D|nr:hypothetical protein [Gilliamella apicola]KFA59528.1 hypothetical protein GAPWKB11_0271 [Gilliamella apicola]OCG32711.1 hypothetical protein A9G33_02725 [Gilliamella apicola]OCG46757.1 hypothetical protein A9G34_04380 [Gilliamella apicola]OCG56516.1 hypothetical protein A9G36_00405 [Gilliamella apicola]OCG62819.1 hypothetical protein A9G48_07235 [Gilliamella apicola]
MKKLLFITLLSFILGGCNSVKYNYVVDKKQFSYPALNVITKTFVGDDIVRQGTVAARDVIEFPHTTVISRIVDYTIQAGEYPKVGEDENYMFFGLKELNSGAAVGKSIFADIPAGIRTDKRNNDLCIITTKGGSLCNSNIIFSYHKKKATNQNTFQQVLIYNGKIGNKINIAYKEFNDDYARPAFSNNVEYDLSNSRNIRYKGVELKVIRATNQYIEYKVLSNFNFK